MKASALKYPVLMWAATLATIIIGLVPFHAFLTVWLSSAVGHYTALRLWKEVLLVVMSLGVAYLLLTDAKIRTHTLTRRLVWLVLGYAGLQLLLGALSLRAGTVTLRALGYGLLINLRFFGFFLLVWAIALRTSRLKNNWQRLLLWPAAAVVAFGLLQMLILPADFLRHFGYGTSTILPYETVNSNRDYVRIMSTLRGPNPLGAYLILPATALLVLGYRATKKRRLVGLLVATILVIAASFSRSAALGLFVSLATVTLLVARSPLAKKVIYGLAMSLLLIGIIGSLAIHKNSRLENIVLHTQTKSAVRTTSNAGHVRSFESGVSDIIHQPQGRGPGTAGPASVYNRGQARIAENYFLQIGQETGIFGLVMFTVIISGVGYLLWLRRADSLALTLFASLVGLSLVNMLSHAWADDTLAYVWWGLAGIAMASGPQVATVEAIAVKVTPVKVTKRVR